MQRAVHGSSVALTRGALCVCPHHRHAAGALLWRALQHVSRQTCSSSLLPEVGWQTWVALHGSEVVSGHPCTICCTFRKHAPPQYCLWYRVLCVFCRWVKPEDVELPPDDAADEEEYVRQLKAVGRQQNKWVHCHAQGWLVCGPAVPCGTAVLQLAAWPDKPTGAPGWPSARLLHNEMLGHATLLSASG